jgi:hypothetical protein
MQWIVPGFQSPAEGIPVAGQANEHQVSHWLAMQAMRRSSPQDTQAMPTVSPRLHHTKGGGHGEIEQTQHSRHLG